tara:strand:- start:6060 stop:6509 length:450 start_codon:yes stop_codon:yes gene_type:complete
MIGSFFKNRREDKQMDDLAEICQSFSYFVTYNCDIDLNNDRKAKKLFQYYMVGFMTVAGMLMDADPEITVGMLIAGLRVGVENGFHSSKSVINFTENSINKLVEKMANEDLNAMELDAKNQGYEDMMNFMSYKDTSVFGNFYKNIVIKY